MSVIYCFISIKLTRVLHDIEFVCN